MAKDEDFRHESLQDRSSIAQHVRAIVEGVGKGHLIVGTDERKLEFHPSGMLEFELQAKRKSGRCKLILKIGWREEDDGASSDALTILTE